MPRETSCGGCTGPRIVGGYFLATNFSDLHRLVLYSGKLQEIDIAFDVPDCEKLRLEKHLLALHGECGCIPASIAVILGISVLLVWTNYFEASVSLIQSVGICFSLAVGAKLLWIAAARLRIARIAQQLINQTKASKARNIRRS